MGIVKWIMVFLLIYPAYPFRNLFEELLLNERPHLIILENVPQVVPSVDGNIGQLHALFLKEEGHYSMVKNELKWNSSNENVASVNNYGVLTYTGESGSTYITVANGIYKDHIKITVNSGKQTFEKQKNRKYDIVSTAVDFLTLEEKIGQMLMPDFRTYNAEAVTNMTPEIERIIKDYHLGGVILFSENLVDTEQAVRLIHEYQQAAEKFGLFLTIDQEGGTVTRLPAGTKMPGNMALGATRSSDLAWKTGNVIGTELAALGINMNLAPVIDVNNNPDNPVIGVRSFSEDPKLVGKLGIAYTAGMQQAGVGGTAKHFPGHGDTSIDSHLGLPQVPHDKERLLEVELVPFQQLIDCGIDSIMTAHVTFPNIDEQKAVSRKTGENVYIPATLSHKAITELLRNEMGFDGVVMTDAMNMKAISDHFGPVDAAIRAINAGADIILMPVGISDVFHGVIDAVKSGEIPLERIDESVERILTLKVKRGIFKEETMLDVDQKVLEAFRVVGATEHKGVEAEVAAKSITVVKNDGKLLPLNREEDMKIVVVGAFSFIESFYAQVNSQYENSTLVKLKSNQTSLTNSQKQTIEKADVVIIGSYTSSADGRLPTLDLTKLYNEVISFNQPTVAVSFGTPYDVMAYPNVNAYIAQYGFGEASFEATVNVIFGKTKSSGILPVTIPSYNGGVLFEFGTGLQD